MSKGFTERNDDLMSFSHLEHAVFKSVVTVFLMAITLEKTLCNFFFGGGGGGRTEGFSRS